LFSKIRIAERGRTLKDGAGLLRSLLRAGINLDYDSEKPYRYVFNCLIAIGAGAYYLESDDEFKQKMGENLILFRDVLLQEALTSGLQINQLYRGETLLMIAASDGSARLVEYLLKHGADPGIKNSKEKTALDMAQDEAQKHLRKNSSTSDWRKLNLKKVISLLGGTHN